MGFGSWLKKKALPGLRRFAKRVAPAIGAGLIPGVGGLKILSPLLGKIRGPTRFSAAISKFKRFRDRLKGVKSKVYRWSDRVARTTTPETKPKPQGPRGTTATPPPRDVETKKKRRRQRRGRGRRSERNQPTSES
jgi:hypothetical protein